MEYVSSCLFLLIPVLHLNDILACAGVGSVFPMFSLCVKGMSVLTLTARSVLLACVMKLIVLSGNSDLFKRVLFVIHPWLFVQ